MDGGLRLRGAPHRNFRLLWIGQMVSVSGSMMQSAAILWHVALVAPPGQKAIALGLVGLVRCSRSSASRS